MGEEFKKQLVKMYEYLYEQAKCRKDKALLKQFYEFICEHMQEVNNEKND